MSCMKKLDELTARRQLKSPWSLSGRSIHLTLVTKWSWSWSWMTYCDPFEQCQSARPFWDTAISKFDHENPWSRSCVWSKVKVTFDLQNSKVKVKPIGHIWGLEFNRYVFFSFCGNKTTFGWDIGNSIWPWKFKVKVMAEVKPDRIIWGLGVQSICLLFVSWQSDHFRLRYSKFHIWPWKFKVKVMAKVKPDGHIWALEFNWYVCFSFRGNRTIFGWDIANSRFDLEKSRSRSRRKSTKI